MIDDSLLHYVVITKVKGDTVVAVSYTHLDVYKRQGVYVGNGEVIEAQGTAYGVVKTE